MINNICIYSNINCNLQWLWITLAISCDNKSPLNVITSLTHCRNPSDLSPVSCILLVSSWWPSSLSSSSHLSSVYMSSFLLPVPRFNITVIVYNRLDAHIIANNNILTYIDYSESIRHLFSRQIIVIAPNEHHHRRCTWMDIAWRLMLFINLHI